MINGIKETHTLEKIFFSSRKKKMCFSISEKLTLTLNVLSTNVIPIGHCPFHNLKLFKLNKNVIHTLQKGCSADCSHN